jgi:hypothetical protein
VSEKTCETCRFASKNWEYPDLISCAIKKFINQYGVGVMDKWRSGCPGHDEGAKAPSAAPAPPVAKVSISREEVAAMVDMIQQWQGAGCLDAVVERLKDNNIEVTP